MGSCNIREDKRECQLIWNSLYCWLAPDPWMAETKETFQIFPPLMFHEYIEGAGILHQTSASLDDNNNNIDISRLVIWHNVAFRPQPFQKSHFHPWVEVEYSSVYMGMGKVGCQGKPEQVVMKLHNNSNMSDLVAFKCGSEDPSTICGPQHLHLWVQTKAISSQPFWS